MIRCILVDDEASAIENLERTLQWYCEDDVQVMGNANNLTDAQSLIKDLQPDLIFLDVDLGKENGFMLFEKIRKMASKIFVIFTTGHSEYAITAFRQEAFDYLLKPVDPSDLQSAIARLKVKLSASPSSKETVADNTTLSLPMQDQIYVCKIGEIVRCESESNYTRFYLQDGSKLLVSKNLGSFEEKLLPHRFFRPHKSHLINLAYLKSYVRTEGGFILMKDESQVPLARNQRSVFFEILEG